MNTLNFFNVIRMPNIIKDFKDYLKLLSREEQIPGN